MRAVIVQHEEQEGAGLLEPALAAAGFTRVNRFRTLKHEDASAELVVVLGGTMGAYETDLHPFLNTELAVLAQRLAEDRSCLGICLGAQLLARAAGVEVFPGKNGLELGVAPVRWTQAGAKDPVIFGSKPKTTVAHWHADTYLPIPGATLLASTDRYTQQAYRLGKSYGFQFHLELTADALSKWYDAEEATLTEKGKDVSKLRLELPRLAAAETELTALIERLVGHFAREARQGSA